MPPPKFGTFLPTGTKGQLTEIPDGGQQWATIRGTALAAEVLGYDSVWVADHVHNVPRARNEALFESFTTLAGLLEATSSIRLGTLVAVSGFRSPSLLAKITATLDVISGGRFELGIGCGWYAEEHAAYGFPFLAGKDRAEALDEAIDVVLSMWTEPETTFRGRFHTVVGAQCDPKPVQRPHPPLWIGGGGERFMLRIAARVATRANFDLTDGPGDWAHKRDVLWEHCSSLGRSPQDIELTWNADLLVTDRVDDAVEMAARLHHDAPNSPRVVRWMDNNLVGTAEQVAEKVQTYMNLGCSYFVLGAAAQPDRHLDSLERFADQVIPIVRPVKHDGPTLRSGG